MPRSPIDRPLLRSLGFEATLRLSVLLALFYAPTIPWTAPLLRVTGASMILVPSLLRHPVSWIALALIATLGLSATWESSDNHKYLIIYWLAACALAVRRSEPASWLSESARWFIAAVFALAVGWKVAAGQYLNGEFWFGTLVTDDRLRGLSAAVTGQSVRELSALRDAIQHLGVQGFDGVSLQMGELPGLRILALSLSWLTLLVEGAVGLAHLTSSDRFYRLRHATLLGFMAGTYFLLPILGFATVLAVMGLSQCRDDDGWLKAAYLFVLAAIHILRLPSEAVIGG